MYVGMGAEDELQVLLVEHVVDDDDVQDGAEKRPATMKRARVKNERTDSPAKTRRPIIDSGPANSDPHEAHLREQQSNNDYLKRMEAWLGGREEPVDKIVRAEINRRIDNAEICKPDGATTALRSVWSISRRR